MRIGIYLQSLKTCIVTGYSIFVVDGELPPCTADDVLSKCPVDPALASRSEPIREDQQQDPDLARAIALSLSKVSSHSFQHFSDHIDFLFSEVCAYFLLRFLCERCFGLDISLLFR